MSLIDEIKEAVSIEDCLSHFDVDVPPRGGNVVMISCPLHDEKTPSMAVYRREGRAWCFGCNQGGDVIALTALLMKADIRDAIKHGAWRLNLSPSRPSAEETARRRRERGRRDLRKKCHLLSHRIEASLPRPHNPELLSAWDAAFVSKDAIDEAYWRDGGPAEMATARRYIRDLAAWRRVWEKLLTEVNGEAWEKGGHGPYG